MNANVNTINGTNLEESFDSDFSANLASDASKSD